MRIKRSRRTVATASVIGLLAAGGAFAYWTTTGSGSGGEETGTGPVAIEIIQTSLGGGANGSGTQTMSPGGAAIALSGGFVNPNTTPTTIHGITAAVTSVTPNFGTTTTCTPANFAIGGTALYSSPVPVGGSSSSPVGSWSGLNIRMVENNANQDDCKSVVARVTYTLVP